MSEPSSARVDYSTSGFPPSDTRTPSRWRHWDRPPLWKLPFHLVPPTTGQEENHSHPILPSKEKKVPFREISHFNSIKFSKLKLRVGPSERQRFYTARNGDSAVFFPKTKTMSSQPNQLNPHPWIENKTLSLKHNYTIKFLANGLTKTLIFLEWKHKPQRERDGETETEERNKDQLHKPFSCFSLSKAGEAAGPLRHLHVRILFILFF